jgi:ubiquinone/menaquinone biosynthesis C-methylase UbiE
MNEIQRKQREAWSRVAPGWRRQAEKFRRFTGSVTERMLEVAAVEPGHRVLDVACGVGEPALTTAQHVGETGRVVAYDLSQPMIDFARERADEAGIANVEFHCEDAAGLELPARSFHAMTMRWGLMFVPDAPALLRKVHAALKPGGRAVLACWTAPEKNPDIHLVQQTARELLDAPAPNPDEPHTFFYADGSKLCDVFEAAGFTDVRLEEFAFTMLEVGSVEEYWEIMSDLSATVTGMLQDVDAATRERFVETLLERAEAYRDGDRIRFPGVTWIASGGKRA